MKMLKKLNQCIVSILIVSMISQPLLASTNNVNSIGSNSSDTTIGLDKTQIQSTEYYDEIESVETIDKETQVYVTQASTFSVTIPKTIILGGQTKNGSYVVKVRGNISSKEIVYVVPEKSFILSQTNKNDIEAIIEQPTKHFTYESGVRENVDVVANGLITANDMTAGSWSGSFMFNIELKEQANIFVTKAINDNGVYDLFTYTISDDDKIDYVEKLKDSSLIEDSLDIDEIIEVELSQYSENFNNPITVTFDVSDIANENDVVVIYHYNKITNQWEYIATRTVVNGLITASFESFSPVAFDVQTDHKHKYTKETIQEPTCTINGTAKYTCECGYSYNAQDIPAIGHNDSCYAPVYNVHTHTGDSSTNGGCYTKEISTPTQQTVYDPGCTCRSTSTHTVKHSYIGCPHNPGGYCPGWPVCNNCGHYGHGSNGCGSGAGNKTQTVNVITYDINCDKEEGQRYESEGIESYVLVCDK